MKIPRNPKPAGSNGGRSSQPAPIPIRVEFVPDTIASAARAFQVMLVLQDLGRILEMDPTQAQIESAAPVRVLQAALETTRSAEDVRQALAAIADVARFEVDGQVGDLSAPAAPLAAPRPEPDGAPQAQESSPPAASEEVNDERLGEFLVHAGLVTQDQLQIAVRRQSEAGRPPPLLGQILVQMGVLSQEALDRAIAQLIQQLRSALRAAQPPVERGLVEKVFQPFFLHQGTGNRARSQHRSTDHRGALRKPRGRVDRRAGGRLHHYASGRGTRP